MVGFERNLYNVSEGDSVTICVEIISPDDIGGNQLYLQVETVENTGQASKSVASYIVLATSQTFICNNYGYSLRS